MVKGQITGNKEAKKAKAEVRRLGLQTDTGRSRPGHCPAK
jgi:hypothetical protein